LIYIELFWSFCIWCNWFSVYVCILFYVWDDDPSMWTASKTFLYTYNAACHDKFSVYMNMYTKSTKHFATFVEII
jgi:hypothetical protein